MPLIPARKRQRQEDLYEFEASLVYNVLSRTARTIERPCLNASPQNKTKKTHANVESSLATMQVQDSVLGASEREPKFPEENRRASAL